MRAPYLSTCYKRKRHKQDDDKEEEKDTKQAGGGGGGGGRKRQHRRANKATKTTLLLSPDIDQDGTTVLSSDIDRVGYTTALLLYLFKAALSDRCTPTVASQQRSLRSVSPIACVSPACFFLLLARCYTAHRGVRPRRWVATFYAWSKRPTRRKPYPPPYLIASADRWGQAINQPQLATKKKQKNYIPTILAPPPPPPPVIHARRESKAQGQRPRTSSNMSRWPPEKPRQLANTISGSPSWLMSLIA